MNTDKNENLFKNKEKLLNEILEIKRKMGESPLKDIHDVKENYDNINDIGKGLKGVIESEDFKKYLESNKKILGGFLNESNSSEKVEEYIKKEAVEIVNNWNDKTDVDKKILLSLKEIINDNVKDFEEFNRLNEEKEKQKDRALASEMIIKGMDF